MNFKKVIFTLLFLPDINLKSASNSWAFGNAPISISPLLSSLKSIIYHLSFIIITSSCAAKIAPPPPPTDTSGYQLIQKITVDAQLMATDKLGQLYISTTKNEVIKYSPEGKELFRFSNNTLGELTHIDVTNPFNILLYYPEYLMVYTLDRTLSKTGEFNLLDLNMTNVEAVAMSNDNNVWLYDIVSYQLKKINRKGDILKESENLSNHFEKPLSPNFILERENGLYVNDPDLGILIFNTFGQYVKTLDFKGLTSFQVFDNQLIFKEKNQLKVFHLQSLATSIINLPDGVTLDNDVVIQKNRLFVMKGNGVEIFFLKT